MPTSDKQEEYYRIKQDIHSILRRVDSALDDLVFPGDHKTVLLAGKQAEELQTQVDYLHSIAIRMGKNVIGAAVERRARARE